jgi:hypothetical protein
LAFELKVSDASSGLTPAYYPATKLIGRTVMFTFLKRRRNLTIALSQQESFARRNAAICELGEPPSTPEAVRALGQIALGRDDGILRRSATSRLANLRSPESLRMLLDILTATATSDNWIFSDARSGLSWNKIALQPIADDAVAALLRAGKSVLAWQRETGRARNQQTLVLDDLRKTLGNLGTASARSAAGELAALLQRQRARELPGLTKIALESGAFEEAQSAVREIAELGTAEAHAALVKIRGQPMRQLDHFHEIDNPDVESGYSPKWSTDSRLSSELGDELKGDDLARWNAAKAQ